MVFRPRLDAVSTVELFQQEYPHHLVGKCHRGEGNGSMGPAANGIVDAIGAAHRWPNLQAVVFERPFVCQIAEEFIQNYDLQDRIRTHEGDMWEDRFPEADLHFYCDIFHDWPPEKCLFLARKSFQDLAPGGRIAVHEMMFDDDKSGPFSVAAYNVNMLIWTHGQQFSRKELAEMLAEAGFVDIQAQRTGFGDWSIVSGRKKRNF